MESSVNDIECREPAHMSIDRTISIVDYSIDRRNFNTILEGVGVAALLSILGFFIYHIFK